MIMDIMSIALVYIAFMGFTLKRLLTYLHIFQQEEYDAPRFLKWVLQHQAFDKRLSLAVIALAILSFFGVSDFAINFLTLIAFSATAYAEQDPRQHSKKKLAMTARAKRIFTGALLIIGALGLAGVYAYTPLFWLLCVHALPLVLALSTLALQPFENKTQKKFWDEAYNKIGALNPKVIAITGSFGKTSVKHILGHILKMHAPTLITPGSVNTPMGIARIVREQLDETHTYFVVEMGAYGPGSIARLCALTPPNTGIITAIGHAHYERFKTLDTVAHTKYELADSVLESGGKMIVHQDTLRFQDAQNRMSAHPDHFIICGTNNSDNHLNIIYTEQHNDGILLSLSWKGETYDLDIPLFGLHHAHNAALAFATAMELGINPKKIQAAMLTLPQISHRLEVKKQTDDILLIDDAYNSNPRGFRSALDLIASLEISGRKILVTPGMIELGKNHDEAHKTLGIYAGQVCDIVLLIKPDRIQSFKKGFQSTGGDKQLLEFSSFKEAAHWIEANKKKGDAILLENDLPDLYERIPRL